MRQSDNTDKMERRNYEEDHFIKSPNTNHQRQVTSKPTVQIRIMLCSVQYSQISIKINHDQSNLGNKYM